MYPVTQSFMAQARDGDQRALFRVEILSSSGDVLYVSRVTIGGQVEEDASRDIRRTCQVTFVDEDGDLTPRDRRDLLVPLGNELRIARGLFVPTSVEEVVDDVYDDVYNDEYGSVVSSKPGFEPEYVPLGVFQISRPQLSSATADGITVNGYDRSRRIKRATLTDTYVIAAGADLDTALTALLIDRWPSCPPLTSTAPAVTLASKVVLDVGTDVWQAIGDLCTAYGSEILFDVLGAPLRRAIPNLLSQAPVVTYERGLTNVITQLERALDDQDTYSGVLALGENTSTSAPIRATAWDDNPTSPTYRGGAFGQVPFQINSDQWTTLAQAQSAAQALLPTKTGLLEETAHEQIPNPALQCSDVVGSEDPVLGVSGTFSLERVVTPLTVAQTQSLTTKARRVLL